MNDRLNLLSFFNTDCDANSNMIWMSVENSYFNNTINQNGGIVKKSESAKQCIGICEKLKVIFQSIS
jgi:hypothetical protein